MFLLENIKINIAIWDTHTNQESFGLFKEQR